MRSEGFIKIEGWYSMAVWMVGCIATIFSKSNRVYIGFVWVCMLALFHFFKLVKGGITKTCSSPISPVRSHSMACSKNS